MRPMKKNHKFPNATQSDTTMQKMASKTKNAIMDQIESRVSEIFVSNSLLVTDDFSGIGYDGRAGSVVTFFGRGSGRSKMVFESGLIGTASEQPQPGHCQYSPARFSGTFASASHE